LNKKACFGGLTLAFLILVTSFFAVPVQAVEVQQYRASFYCAAGGDSLIVTKWGVFPWGGPMMEEWFIGRSTVTFIGSGVVEQQSQVSPTLPYPGYYTSNGIQAGGCVFACWGNQIFSVLLYSKGEAGGGFVNDTPTDLFSVGSEAGMGLVYYKGTYRDATGTHAVNGQAVISVTYAPGSTIEMMSFSFLKSDGTVLSIIMFNADMSGAPWGVQREPIYFAQSVKINPLS
jgi:hypothetical protein